MFCRIPSAYKDSLDYFALSGLTLRDIVDRASKSGQAVAEGVIYYLEEKLLASDEPVHVSEVGRFLLDRYTLFLKWHCDQKINSIFCLDFKTMLTKH